MPVPPKDESMFQRKSLREAAAEQIRAAIFDGTLLPGETLNDHDLQDWLGVSRTPIREALNDLARVGLIEMAPQRYTRVAEPNAGDRTHVMQTMGALVGGVVRLTVPTLTDAQRTTLLGCLDATIVAVENRAGDEAGRLRWQLVDEFVQFCRNPVLVRATRDIIDSLAFQLTVTRTEDDTAWESLEENYPLLRAAITSGDAIAAELAVESVFRLSESAA
ncbi:GntR family transcriptional regulator [Plantibacter sp. Mn2098]|uniref:GntR family transcriptional regulator n=1 Tax=Plantibacter sp. Mn2098 TaxID=3395266 RepID=UPI003BBD3656